MTLKKDSILVEFSFSKGFEWIKKAKSPDKIIKHVCPPLYCRKLLIWAVKNHIYVSGQVFTKKERFFFLNFGHLTPGITEKKVPPRHESRYIGSTLDVVYRKLKVVEAPITFAIGS